MMKLIRKALFLLPALISVSCTRTRPEITWSVMHPTDLDTVYMKRLIDECRNHPMDNFEVCGGCNSGCDGSLDGLLLFEEYPLARSSQNEAMVQHNRKSLKRIIEMAHDAGKAVYYWHREALCNDGLVKSIPGLLDANGELDLFGKPYEELLRYKLRKTFEIVPDLDGLVLTLTEASFSTLHNSHPDIYPPEKVVAHIGGIFAEELESRGKRFILRSFGSISEDYEAIQKGAEELAEKHRFEIETKITPYDFNPFLPDNPFLTRIKGCTLGAECDVLGEFLGCGRMLPEQVEDIQRYVAFAKKKKVDRFTIRLDRKGKSVFDVYPINLYAYEQAILNPGRSADEIRREFYSRTYSPRIAGILSEMSRDGMECVKKTQFIAGNLIFHWYPTTPDLRLMKAGGILGVFAPEGNLSAGRKQWAMLSFNDVPGRDNIIREKQDALEIAERNLARLETIKDSLTFADSLRLSEGWTASRAEAMSIGELCKVICGYFESMESRDTAAAAMNAAFVELRKKLDGEWLLRPVPALAERVLEEYPMELALRRDLDARAQDYVLPGCITDQGRVEHYMHGSFCEVRNGVPVTIVGNTVFPDGYIRVKLKGSTERTCIVVRGSGVCTVSVGGESFRVVLDGGHGIFPVPADESGYDVYVRKADGCDFPVVESVSLEKDALAGLVRSAVDFCRCQSLAMYERIRPMDGLLVDRTDREGNFLAAEPWQWTAGFFPGTLWLLYGYSGGEELRAAAADMTSRMLDQQYNTGTHDIGFMMNCSCGQALRFTADSVRYKSVLVNSARSLATRFDQAVGCIRSWAPSPEKKWDYVVIIDNMMNLELLMNAARMSGDESLREIALKHALTTMKNHFRSDASCYHVVNYDSGSGKVLSRQTAQGLADDSAWARGQGWALYGYTMMYRETGDRRFLDQAVKVGEYILRHPGRPSDRIPYWDFDAPSSDSTPRDASAAAVFASAYLELSGCVTDRTLSEAFRTEAERLLVSLSNPDYTAAEGENADFILKHSTINMNKDNYDTPVVYADYYYVEALTRFLKMNV